MTKQDKDLVYKDICARLPYDVIVHVTDSSTRIHDTYLHEAILARFGNNQAIVRPYLRPMSSMTKEEKNELAEMTITSPNLETAAVLFREQHYEEAPHWRDDWAICSLLKVLNWLNAHHFDYRGLIPKGLAIEVTKENNPYK